LASGTSYEVNYTGPVGNPTSGSSVSADSNGEIIINDLVEGSYTNINVDDGSCTSNDESETLSDPSPPVIETAFSNPTSCGTDDGEIEISGLVSGVSYTVIYTGSAGSPASGTMTTATTSGNILIQGLVADSYTNISVVDGGCISNEENETLTDPDPPSISTSSEDPSECGGDDGEIEIAGLNSGTSYVVNYSGTAGSPVSGSTVMAIAGGKIVISNLSAGSYSNITVEEGSCVSDSESETLNDPDPVVISTSKSDPTSCGGDDGTITISGLVSFTDYQVNYSGSTGNPSNGTTVTSTNSGTILISGLVAGTYTKISVGSGACLSNESSETLSDPSAVAISTESTNPTTCAGSDGTITINGLVNGTTYQVNYNSPSGGTPSSGTTAMASAGSIVITGLVEGSYTGINVSESGCTSNSGEEELSDPNGPSMTDPSDQTVCAGIMTTAVNFAGAGSGASYSWINNNTSIGLGASGTNNITAFTALNTGTTNQVATITVTPELNNCSGASEDFTITVKPTPSVSTVTNKSVCAGATVAEISFSGNLSGTSYSWTNDNTSIGLGATGTGPITAFTATNTTGAAITGNIIVTPVNSGCTGATMSFSITVNPAPTANSVSDQTVCNGASTAAVTFAGAGAMASYGWTNDNMTIGLGASGTGNIPSFVATNTGSSTQTATVTFSPSLNGCAGTPQTFKIIVNPTPAVNTVGDVSACPGETVNVTFAGVPATGVTYDWTNSNANIGLVGMGSGNISFVSNNSGNSAISSMLTVTPTANGCVGGTRTFTINVNPEPNLQNVPDQSVCTGDNTTAISFVSSVNGSTVSWSNSNNSIGLGATGTGTIPSFIASNNGSSTNIATIRATPSANGCVGDPESFSISVLPTPSLNPVPEDIFLCNGENQSTINFNGPVTGTDFSWSAFGNPVGLSSNSGNGNLPGFQANNNTNTDRTAIITVSSIANGCEGKSEDFNITVRPTPEVNALDDIEVCKGESIGPISFSGPVSNTSYSWNNTNTAIGLGFSGNGNTISSFDAENNTNSTISGTVAVLPNYEGCDGDTELFTIQVRPEPSVFNLPNLSFCHKENSGVIDLDGPTNNTEFDWSNSNTSIGLGSSGTGDIMFVASNLVNTIISSTISVTPSVEFNSGLTCVGEEEDFVIEIRPEPSVDAISNKFYCENETTTEIDISGPVNNTTYTWRNNNTNIGLSTTGTNRISSFTTKNERTPEQEIFATVTIEPEASGCEGPEEEFVITVWDNPNAEFSLLDEIGRPELQVAAPIIATQEVTTGTPAFDFQWNFSPSVPTFLTGFGRSGPVTQFVYDDTTNYKITLEVTDDNGCTDSHTEDINLDPNSVCGANFSEIPDVVCVESTIELEVIIDSPNGAVGDLPISETLWKLTSAAQPNCCGFMSNSSSGGMDISFAPLGQTLNIETGESNPTQKLKWRPTIAGVYELCLEFRNGTVPCENSVSCVTIEVAALPSISSWDIENEAICQGDSLVVIPQGIPLDRNYIFDYSINGIDAQSEEVSTSFRTSALNPNQDIIQLNSILDTKTGCINNSSFPAPLTFNVTPGLEFDVEKDVNIDVANCNPEGDMISIEINLPSTFTETAFTVPSIWERQDTSNTYIVSLPINETYRAVVTSELGDCDLTFDILGEDLFCDCSAVFPIENFDVGTISNVDDSGTDADQYLLCESAEGNIEISDIVISGAERFDGDAKLAIQIYETGTDIEDAEYLNIDFPVDINTSSGIATLSLDALKDFIGDNYNVAYNIQPVFNKPATFCPEPLTSPGNQSQIILLPDPEPIVQLDPNYIGSDICVEELIPVIISLDEDALSINPAPVSSYVWELNDGGSVKEANFRVDGNIDDSEFTQFLLFETIADGSDLLTVTQNLNYRSALTCSGQSTLAIETTTSGSSPDVNEYSIYLWPGNILVLDYQENSDLQGSAPTTCFQWGRVDRSTSMEDDAFNGPASQWFVLENDDELQNLLTGNGDSNPYLYFVDISDCTTGCSNRIYLDENELIIIRDDDKVRIGTEWKLHPNPSNGLLNLSYNGSELDNYSIHVYNRIGQRVHTEQIVKSEPSFKQALDLTGIINTGLHYIHISSTDGTSWTYPIVFN